MCLPALAQTAAAMDAPPADLRDQHWLSRALASVLPRPLGPLSCLAFQGATAPARTRLILSDTHACGSGRGHGEAAAAAADRAGAHPPRAATHGPSPRQWRRGWLRSARARRGVWKKTRACVGRGGGRAGRCEGVAGHAPPRPAVGNCPLKEKRKRHALRLPTQRRCTLPPPNPPPFDAIRDGADDAHRPRGRLAGPAPRAARSSGCIFLGGVGGRASSGNAQRCRARVARPRRRTTWMTAPLQAWCAAPRAAGPQPSMTIGGEPAPPIVDH